jgi:hypothetical protein
VQIFWMDTYLIWVALSVVIRAGLSAHIVVLLAEMRTYQRDRKKKKARNGGSLFDLCRSCRVGLSRFLR